LRLGVFGIKSIWAKERMKRVREKEKKRSKGLRTTMAFFL